MNTKERVLRCVPRRYLITRVRLWNSLPLDIIEWKKFEDALDELVNDGYVVITSNLDATLADIVQRVKVPNKYVLRIKHFLQRLSR